MAIHLKITGLVQGVGYRQWFRRHAEAHGASGWVRNRADGSVEALLLANDQALEALMREAMTGPLGAKVDSIDQTFVTLSDPERTQVAGFEIRATI
ncbi:acylphosphatase [Phreatobacter aquaticus]|uniref:acylphosphatase n=1 Tax=Phreatobacter aquaticus TaxID=2570229 RepID=A0A4D7QSJ8_9HYPH|nr:acylphosphatase [Phreatobacter aquaticus]QCK87052.1 acylphosphatase [Phreatobacter aquaticus]